MLIDAHMHVNFKHFRADDIVKYLDKNRIDCCWLLTWEEVNPGGWPYRHLSIEDVWDAYCKYPSRIMPMYAPDPARTDAPSDLEAWYRRGVRGCGELKATLDWGSPGVRSLIDSANNLGAPVVFHMEEARRVLAPRSSAVVDRLLCAGLQSTRPRYGVARECLKVLTRASPLRNRTRSVSFPGYMLDFASLQEALADFPGVNFIGHGPMFWKEMSSDAEMSGEMYPKGPVTGRGRVWRLLTEYQNLFADTSGVSGFNALIRDPGNAKRFLSLFEDKILYGTDNHVLGQMQFLESLHLGKQTLRRILGENADRLARATGGVSTPTIGTNAEAESGDPR